MGLLLGYPIEDVRGFIEHNGCGCLYSGYWKVYRNVPLKKKMFEDFEKAKESVIQLLAEDIDMRLILEIYKRRTAADSGIGGFKMSKISVVIGHSQAIQQQWQRQLQRASQMPERKQKSYS